jgi:hypothetical protein
MHDLQVIDVFWPQRVPMQPQFTDVLYGCRDCAHVETVTIDGKWSMEQVTRLHRDDSNGKLYDPQDGA